MVSFGERVNHGLSIVFADAKERWHILYSYQISFCEDSSIALGLKIISQYMNFLITWFELNWQVDWTGVWHG